MSATSESFVLLGLEGTIGVFRRKVTVSVMETKTAFSIDVLGILCASHRSRFRYVSNFMKKEWNIMWEWEQEIVVSIDPHGDDIMLGIFAASKVSCPYKGR